MKKILVVSLIFLLYSCSKKYCTFIEDNDTELKELLHLIKKNPKEFSNYNREPRVYLTNKYKKQVAEFEKIKVLENLDMEDYKSLRAIFNDLSIEEVIIYNHENVLFKVSKVDFFVSDYSFYIGHIVNKDSLEIEKKLEIVEFKECGNDWFYVLERNSIAN